MSEKEGVGFPMGSLPLPVIPEVLSSLDSSSLTDGEAATKRLPELLRRPPKQALWQLARPTIAIALLRTAYGIIDSYWLQPQLVAHHCPVISTMLGKALSGQVC